MILSKRLELISESTTLKLNALVQSLKAQGQDVINLTAGEPDFAPPQQAIEEIKKRASLSAESKYTPVPGLKELREEIAEGTAILQSISKQWSFENVIVTHGAKHALAQIFMATLNKNDEVLIPAPYWLSYPEMVLLADGKPVIMETKFEDDYLLKPDVLKKYLTSKTKLIILNSPSNPTGAVYTKSQFQAVGKIIFEHIKMHPECFVVSDEIYNEIVFEGEKPACSFLKACPELKENCITVNGASKNFAMTGWRIGWAIGPKTIIQAMNKIQGQSTSGVNRLAQWAALAALRMDINYFEENRKTFGKRRNLLMDILSKSERIKVRPPKGAFYAFLELGEVLRGQEDSVSFCEQLLEKAQVAVVPGVSFGSPWAVRMSFATSEKNIQEGCHRFVKFLEKF